MWGRSQRLRRRFGSDFPLPRGLCCLLQGAKCFPTAIAETLSAAGAGQVLLRVSGMVAPRAVLAGSGPRLCLLAVQMARAGRPPLALIETQSLREQLAAAPRLAGGLWGWNTVIKRLGLLADLRRHATRRITGARDLEGTSTGRACGLRLSAQGRALDRAALGGKSPKGFWPGGRGALSGALLWSDYS